MSRVVVIVEGATEESFVAGPLAEALWTRQVCLTPIILGVPGHKGGRPNYARVQKDLLRQLKQDPTAYCSTMIDFYGLGQGFPGTPPPAHLANLQKVEHIERAIKEDICGRIPDFRPDVRLIPYLSLHEYEGLLFSDPDALAQALTQPDLADRFHQIRSHFPTPEDIDDSPETAPSKRILAIYSAYRKVIQGTLAARAVGVERMRRECPHFRNWIEQLETLPDP
ncbi:MAG: DUF4276 family protein [Bryobacteraceae bacterium]